MRLFRNNRVDDGHVYGHYEYSTSPERILGMDLREVLFPQLLKKAGYINGIFGKWDLGQLDRFLPLQRGFDQFYGFVNTGIDYYTHERYFYPSMYRNNKPTTEDKGTYATDLFEREALRFIQRKPGSILFSCIFHLMHHMVRQVLILISGVPSRLRLNSFPCILRKQDQREERRRGIYGCCYLYG